MPRGFVVTLSGSRSLIGPSVEGRGLERVTSSLGTFFFLQSSLYFCQVLIDEKNKGISRDGTDRDPKRQSRFPL